MISLRSAEQIVMSLSYYVSIVEIKQAATVGTTT